MNLGPYQVLLERSMLLSQPYWDFYRKMIGPTTFTHNYKSGLLFKEIDDTSDYDPSESTQNINQEYLDFIRVTREHQKERERLKRLDQGKTSKGFDEYYKDLSQVDTLVEENLAPVPSKCDGVSKLKQQEERLVQLYGGRENFERIRSLEMDIDGNFRRMCQEYSPYYWPVIPINPKPYLNSLNH